MGDGGGGMLRRGMVRLMGRGMRIWGCQFCDVKYQDEFEVRLGCIGDRDWDGCFGANIWSRKCDSVTTKYRDLWNIVEFFVLPL
jgi:hypothetical protein